MARPGCFFQPGSLDASNFKRGAVVKRVKLSGDALRFQCISIRLCVPQKQRGLGYKQCIGGQLMTLSNVFPRYDM